MRQKMRIWSVSQFAEHLGITHRQARERLKRLDAKHGGKVLLPSCGANRRYTVVVAALRRLEPDYFAPVEDVESRLEQMEETLDEVRRHLRMLGAQVGQNSRDIARRRAA